MRRRIACTTLAGLFAALVLAQPAEACHRRARRCGGGQAMGHGHGGRYVTYNGANFATYNNGGGYAPYNGAGHMPYYGGGYAPTNGGYPHDAPAPDFGPWAPPPPAT